MDVAEELIHKIFSSVDLQRECADKLIKLAKELEEHKKNVNISKVAGSSAAVGGAAAMTAAGVIAICTAGAAIPFLAAAGVAGAVVSGLGAATSIGSEVTSAVISSCTMKEAEKISEQIQDLEKGIQKLMESLKEEGNKREQQDGDDGDYVVEQILRAMAKHSGLVLNDKINLHNMMSVLSKSEISGKDTAFSLLGESLHGLALFSKFAIQAAAKKSGKTFMTTGFTKMAASMGTKTAAKAVGRVGGGAVGLLFSVPELIIDVKNLIEDDCKTEASQSLRKKAEALKTASKEMKQQLDNIKEAFQRLAKVQHSVENSNRSSGEKKTLIEFAIEQCKDETLKRWLRENSESDAFSQLVDMFHLLKKHIDEEEKKNHSYNIDIIFVAHGSIRDYMIPASCLLPLSSITDVILYSPWNCSITASVVYGIATGRMKPQHRKFYCGEKDDCQIPDEKPRPSKLPDHWNSMKKAEDQKIPNITVGPMKPEDGAWESFEFLQDINGRPGRNRVIVPFILPGKSSSLESVPFFIVTLALSLVLFFSRFEATIHLAACLSDSSARKKFDQEHLKQQYACTIDNTSMHASLNLEDVHLNLYSAFKAMFG